MNRLTVKDLPGSDPNIYYTYNSVGRLTDANDGGEVTAYSYNRIGYVTDINSVDGKVISYEYNDLGVAKLVYPDDSYVTYKYDSLSRLTAIKDDEGNTLADYDYDELFRKTQITLGNGTTVIYDYIDYQNNDNLGDWIEKLTNNLSAGSEPNKVIFEYTCDSVGNRLTMEVDGTDRHRYKYDNIYQLMEVNYPGNDVVGYSYDALGNRNTSMGYTSNSLNQYTVVDSVSYTYDDNGNLFNDGTYKYYYDYENHLTDANTVGNVKVVSYKYDYLGRRISKTVDGTITKYCYSENRIIAEYEDDVLVRKFVYGTGELPPFYVPVVVREFPTYTLCIGTDGA